MRGASNCFDAISGGSVELTRHIERLMELNNLVNQQSFIGLMSVLFGKFASTNVADLIQRNVQSLEKFLNALSGGLY